jgi:hypothetical protein
MIYLLFYAVFFERAFLRPVSPHQVAEESARCTTCTWMLFSTLLRSIKNQ